MPLWVELQVGHLFVLFLEEEMARSMDLTVNDMAGSPGTQIEQD